MAEKSRRCSSSNKKTKTVRERGEDKITYLPDSNLHEILSFLDMKQVIRTSFLSRKWRYLWKSVPDVRFTDRGRQSTSYGNKKVYEKNKRMDFISRALLLRDDSNIRKYYLSFRLKKPILWGRIVTWIYFLLMRGVKEVHLDVDCMHPTDSTEVHELPLILFTSSVEVFEWISSYCYWNVQVPVSMFSAPRLRKLELVSAQLPEGGSNGELVLSYPVLEFLILRSCIDSHLTILNISALHLKKLVIENPNPNMVSYRFRVSACVLKICTPNLTSLQLGGCFYKDYILENLLSVVTCTIYGLHNSLHANSLMKIINGLHSNVATLELGGSRKENSTGSKLTLDQELNSFLNLRCLKLKNLHDASLLRFVANFFEGTPIETLVMDLEGPIYDINWLGKVSLPDIFYKCLKHVKILNLRCCMNELMFLQGMLQNAVTLEDITVTFTKETSKHNEKEKAFFRAMLQSFCKVSSK